MNMTKIKKIVGTLGATVSSISIWLLANEPKLTALFPKYGNDIVFVTAIIGLLASWWGKHPGSSASVSDLPEGS